MIVCSDVVTQTDSLVKKETVDLCNRSWLCSIQVGSSSDVNLRLVVNRLEIRLIDLILGGI